MHVRPKEGHSWLCVVLAFSQRNLRQLLTKDILGITQNTQRHASRQKVWERGTCDASFPGSFRACACRGCSRCDLLVVHCWLVEVVRERLCEYEGVSAVLVRRPVPRSTACSHRCRLWRTCSFFDGELQHAALAAPHRRRLCRPSHAWSIDRG